MNRLVYILLVALILTGTSMYWLYNRYQKLTAEYSNSVENNKAYEAELNNETDSLIRAIKGGWITIEQVPEELLEVVSEKLNVKKDK